MQNSLTLIGTVATDILPSTDEEGMPVARFRIVTHTRTRDRTTNNWINEPPTFMTVTCTKKLARNVAVSLHRGDPVIVTGRLRVRENPDKRLTRVEIEATGVGPDLNRSVATPVREGSRAAA